jgi:hypothetical protein
MRAPVVETVTTSPATRVPAAKSSETPDGVFTTGALNAAAVAVPSAVIGLVVLPPSRLYVYVMPATPIVPPWTTLKTRL